MQENKKTFVGIDLGKRMLEAARINDDDSIERFQSKTDAIGRQRLLKWLRPSDVIALEAGNLSFLLAKSIMTINHNDVYVLNAGDIAVIYNSLKKTDKEDSLKLARLIKRHPIKELPVVRIPDKFEEDARIMISEQEYWVTSRTRAFNRLHSIITNTGLTTVTKKEIKNPIVRKTIIDGLDNRARQIANRLLMEIELSEDNIKKIEVEITDMLKEKKDETKIIMSVTGIAKITTLTIMAYIGDGSRFSRAEQVSYYAGLVPRIDISGDTERNCRIIKRGCHQLKRLMIQCAWSLVISKKGGYLKEKFNELSKRKGKGKAIVAVARKMLELVYHLLRNGETCNFTSEFDLNRKLAFYKII
jgi:transposase